MFRLSLVSCFFCFYHISFYNPFSCTKLPCFPVWVSRPFSTTKILLAYELEDNLWDIIIKVLLIFSNKFSIILFSVFEFNESVDSKRISMCLSVNNILAIATLYFSPPDNLRPLSPTWFAKPSRKLKTIFVKSTCSITAFFRN